jgi:hypothetical protein
MQKDQQAAAQPLSAYPPIPRPAPRGFVPCWAAPNVGQEMWAFIEADALTEMIEAGTMAPPHAVHEGKADPDGFRAEMRCMAFRFEEPLGSARGLATAISMMSDSLGTDERDALYAVSAQLQDELRTLRARWEEFFSLAVRGEWRQG